MTIDVAMDAAPRSLLRGAFIAALAGLVLVVARYHDLPDWLFVYRTWSGAATRLMPKSAVSALRIPLMGVAQLVAATLLAAQSRRRPGWLRFWTGTGVAIGVKTLLESLDFVRPTTAWLAPAGPTVYVATLAVVAVYAGWAVWQWQSRRLERGFAIERSTIPWLVVALGLYLGLATWPMWSAAPSRSPAPAATSSAVRT